MERRQAITNAAAMALAAMSAAAMSTAAMAGEHDHHHMHGNKNQALVDSAADCIVKGETCIAHCLDLLAEGDKEMAACAKSVNQMLALCNALVSLGTQQSKYLPALSKVALDACEFCEKECRKHEQKHEQCKACADSCAACIKQCKAVSA
jgi:Cys-rich four helix bundle protein (predicted Tat secretion target)